jgi:hypothetical protein
MYTVDQDKQKLFHGLVQHYPAVPKWIIYRTVELASSPGIAFDAVYDFNVDNLPVIWDFIKEKWVRERLVVD